MVAGVEMAEVEWKGYLLFRTLGMYSSQCCMKKRYIPSIRPKKAKEISNIDDVIILTHAVDLQLKAGSGTQVAICCKCQIINRSNRFWHLNRKL